METAQPMVIGSRRELFVDDTLVDTMVGDVGLKLTPPERKEVVFQVQGPLENACSAVYSVLVESDGQYMLYYRGHYPLKDGQGDESQQQTAHVALSEDGIHFERPTLGIYDFGDQGANNVVWQGNQGHNFVPFLDNNPVAPSTQRYKAVGGVGRDNLYGFYAEDGLHWHLIRDTPLAVPGAFDSANVAFWDAVTGKYRLFSRDFTAVGGKNYRVIRSCESQDFIHWTDPVMHKYDEGTPLEEFYTNGTTPCPGAEHILLSFPMRYVIERLTPVEDTSAMEYPGGSSNAGMTDAVMMSSRDGVHWKRPFLEAWLRPGLDERSWTHRNTCPAIGILCTSDREWSMYVSEHYGWADNRLRRLAIRPWGLASVHGGYDGGEMVTKPFIFSGTELRLNLSTSAVGSVGVEVQDSQGRAMDGYQMENMTPIYGDALDHKVTWQGGVDVGALAGSVVRLRVVLNDADLYALRFVEG